MPEPHEELHSSQEVRSKLSPCCCTYGNFARCGRLVACDLVGIDSSDQELQLRWPDLNTA